MTNILTSTVDITTGTPKIIVWNGAPLNSINCPPDAQINIGGVAYFVDHLTDTTHPVLTSPYAGSIATGVVAEISPYADATLATLNERTATLLGEIEATDAYGRGLKYIYVSGTGLSDPGPGNIAFNNSDPRLATGVAIDNLDASNLPVDTLIQSWDDSTNSVKATLVVRSIATQAYVAYTFTGTFTGSGFQTTSTLTVIDSGGTLAIGEPVMVWAERVGGVGTNGTLTAIEAIKTADYTLLVGDKGGTFVANKATAINFFFSAAATLGSTWMVLVKNIGVGTLTLDPNGSETIEGLSSITLTTGEAAIVWSNGTMIRIMDGISASSNGKSMMIAANYAAMKTLLTLDNVDNTSDVTKNSATATLTNKLITPRIGSVASSATPSPDASANDQYEITALAVNATFSAPSGTPIDGQRMIIRVKDNGTSRTLTFNAIYRAVGVVIPPSTTISKTLYMGIIYNSADTKWDMVALTQEV